jgi:hypothetical protein
MSKRTTYGKRYHPDVRFVQTSTSVVQTSMHVRNYPADAVLPRDGFLPVRTDSKNASTRILADLSARRGHASRGHWHHASARARVPVGSTLTHPRRRGLARPRGHEEASMRTRF